MEMLHYPHLQFFCNFTKKKLENKKEKPENKKNNYSLCQIFLVA